MKRNAVMLAVLAAIVALALPCCAQQSRADQATASGSLNASSAPASSPASGASTVPGRLSSEQLRAVFAAADEEDRQALSALFQQTSALPKALLEVQQKVSSYQGLLSDPRMQKISELQARLGPALAPKKIDDLEAMNLLLMDCKRSFANLISSDAFTIFPSTRQAIELEKQRQQRAESIKNVIRQAESALDQGQLVHANEIFQQLAAVASLPPFAQSYLQQTQAMRLDVDAKTANETLKTGELMLVTYAGSVHAGGYSPHDYYVAVIRRCESEATCNGTGDPYYDLPADQHPLEFTITCDWVRGYPAYSPHCPMPGLDSPQQGKLYRVTGLAQDAIQMAITDRYGRPETGTVFRASQEMSQRLAQYRQEQRQKQEAAAEAARAADRAAEIEAKERAAEEAEEERLARIERQKPTMVRFGSQLRVIRGRRYKVLNPGVGDEILQSMLEKIPQKQMVDLIAMYRVIDGTDGSTTLQALAKSKASFVGKYFMLKGDVFQIQSDRDYPVEGRNEFSMFGNVNFTDTYHIPVNVLCISAEKVPPYRLSPVLGKIVDFKLGKNRMGKSIIIPVVDVVALLGTQPYTNANEEVIINQP